MRSDCLDSRQFAQFAQGRLTVGNVDRFEHAFGALTASLVLIGSLRTRSRCRDRWPGGSRRCSLATQPRCSTRLGHGESGGSGDGGAGRFARLSATTGNWPRPVSQQPGGVIRAAGSSRTRPGHGLERVVIATPLSPDDQAMEPGGRARSHAGSSSSGWLPRVSRRAAPTSITVATASRDAA